jgi:hypothetical protein
MIEFMELNIEEVDDDDVYNVDNDEVDDLGYSDNPITKGKIKYVNPYANFNGLNGAGITNSRTTNTIVSKKKEVTYDDILSTLNMQVVNGKLQISRTIPVENNSSNSTRSTSTSSNSSSSRYTMPGSSTVNIAPVLTPEQQRRARIIQYVNYVNEQRRIKQVKSTKMFFNNPHISTSTTTPLSVKRFIGK